MNIFLMQCYQCFITSVVELTVSWSSVLLLLILLLPPPLLLLIVIYLETWHLSLQIHWYVPIAFKAIDVCPSSCTRMLKELLCEHNWVLVYEMSSCGMHMQKWRAGSV
jgi:hypothetical protein